MRRINDLRSSLILLILWSCVPTANARQAETKAVEDVPSILLVTAHPDDEALFGGLVYRVAVELGARVELAVVTDGAGGYRYSTLAEPVYGLDLTNPEVAREYLAAIRKRELLAGGRFVGIRKYHFLDETDSGYTTDPDSILAQVWDGGYVENRLVEIMSAGDFDIVLTHLPQESMHGHHKSASILGIRAARRLGAESPIVLGAWIDALGDSTETRFDVLEGYPDTRTTSTRAKWTFDRTHGIGLDGRLNYKIPVNWLISEHKSQGTMQQIVNVGDVESYWLYESNPEGAEERANDFFDWVNTWPEESPGS